MIVKMLMTGKAQLNGKVIRQFEFDVDKISVKEEIQAPPNAQYVKHVGKFTAIHMASSGYHSQHLFQAKSASPLIEFK